MTSNRSSGGLTAAEAETLVLASRINLLPEERERFQGLLSSRLDWERLLAASVRLRVHGLLFKHLHGSDGRPLVSAGIVERLEREYRIQTVRSLSLYGQIARILDAAGEKGLGVLLLKGAWLARWVYGDSALRPFDDIDLLCREEAVPGLVAVLQQLGYRQRASLDRSRVHARMFFHLFHHLPPFEKPGGARVELHTSLTSDQAGQSADMEAVWRRAFGLLWEGRRAYALSAEDQVFHLSSHLAAHLEMGSMTLGWFCDIHEVIRIFSPSLDWALILSLASAARNERRLCGLWQQLRSYWGTPFPRELTGRLAGASAGPGLPALVRGGLEARPEAGTIRRYARLLMDVREIPSRRDRLVYLWRQLFPDGEYLRGKYGIAEGRGLQYRYAYHLFVGCRNVWRDLLWKLRSALKA
jgi:hypothetical protein